MGNSKGYKLEEILRIAGAIRKILNESGVPQYEVDSALDQMMGAINKALRCVVGVNQEKVQIILIDDEEMILDFMARHLENQGYKVIPSVDPTVCEAILRDVQCVCFSGVVCGDLLITDNQMPRITGIDFIESQLQRDCKISVENKAVMSGKFEQEDIERINRIGCARFEKPISFVVLNAWLGQCVSRIDRSRLLRNLIRKV